MRTSPDELIKELRKASADDSRYPFPHTGCRRLLKEGGKELDDLIPYLDLYLMDLAGYASCDFRISEWPKEELLEAKAKLSKSFFEKHPKYKRLETLVTGSNTQDLYACMVIYEKIRTILLELCDEILAERYDQGSA